MITIKCVNLKHFYSHIPCGMWPNGEYFFLKDSKFLLTHPVWDVTCNNVKEPFKLSFLLTHPVWDVTTFQPCIHFGLLHFYSHIPCGMWHIAFFFYVIVSDFYSHIPCGMWRVFSSTFWTPKIFLLTHPVWDVTITNASIALHLIYFYSHIPCGMWLLYIVYYSLSIPIYHEMDL